MEWTGEMALLWSWIFDECSLPATIGSACFNRDRTGLMRPTSVQACRFRTLFRRMAMKMLHISACKRHVNRRKVSPDHPPAETLIYLKIGRTIVEEFQHMDDWWAVLNDKIELHVKFATHQLSKMRRSRLRRENQIKRSEKKKNFLADGHLRRTHNGRQTAGTSGNNTKCDWSKLNSPGLLLLSST